MKKNNKATQSSTAASDPPAAAKVKRINGTPHPTVPAHIVNLLKLRRLEDKDAHFPDEVPLNSRVYIVEGISGSGKDTFQDYLAARLKGRTVYNYSEGDLLQSWKQLQIDGIFDLRIKYMTQFVKFVKNTIERNENAVFVLNRFHLSTYVSTIVKHPELRKEYDEMIDALRKLPVHVFILQLNTNEIAERSLHPERSGAWHQHRKQIIKKDGFPDTLQRHIWQQKLVFETAMHQQIPYSVIKLPYTATDWKDIRTENVPRTDESLQRFLSKKMMIGDSEI